MSNEAAAYAGASTISIMTDIKKCYDPVPHDVLLAEAASQQFPPQTLHMALAICQVDRVLMLDGARADAMLPSRSILAGEGNATAALRALMLSSLDRIWNICLGLSLTVVVDDVTARLTGSERAVLDSLPVLIEGVLEQLEGQLRLPASLGEGGKLWGGILEEASPEDETRAREVWHQGGDQREIVGL